MFGSVTLEVAIGIIFIFILVSILCSAIREGIEAWLKTRASYLAYGIRELLHDKRATGLAKSLYEHPLIAGLYEGPFKPAKASRRPRVLANGGRLPSYIPTKNFAVALMDIAARGPETDEVSSHPDSPVISLDSIRRNIANLENVFVQRVLLTAIDNAQGDLNKAQKNIEAWYDSSMDRVSGWYKRSTGWVIFWIGIVVAVGLNVNTVTLADYLYKNDGARKAMVARAEEAAKDTSYTSRSYDQAKKDLESLNLPIGWSMGWGAISHGDEEGSKGWWNNVWAPLLGWLATALAATMGAPFWFDLLNKVMVIRSTVKPHEKSPEEGSEDRQHPQPQPPATLAEAPPATGRPQTVIRTVSAPSTTVSNIRDDQSSIDGCEVDIVEFTTDEQLPPAEGGVA